MRGFLRYFTPTLKSPERTTASRYDPGVVICYRYLSRRKTYLAIVVHTHKKFIITAYLAKKPKRDTL